MLDSYYLYASRVAYMTLLQRNNTMANNNEYSLSQTPTQIIDMYISDYFYQLTWYVYVPLIGLIHLPLNFVILYYLYLDKGSSTIKPFLQFCVVASEIISLFSQMILGYAILLSPASLYLIEYNSILWKYTYAALLYCALLFLANDGSKLLLIIYFNNVRTGGMREACERV
jgi:hypothetical protein